MSNILELITKDTDSLCKILLITLHVFARVWYHNLEYGYILHFCDLRSKIIFCFNVPKRTLKSFFFITQREYEGIRAYFKRFDEEMLNMKRLLEPITTKYLISGV